MSNQVELFQPNEAPITIFQPNELEGFMDSFEIPEGSPETYTMDDKISLAINSIVAALKLRKCLSVMVSFGKDSSVLLALTLCAVEKAKDLGIDHPAVRVIHGNTQRENPVMAEYTQHEITKLIEFINRKELNVKFHIATPRLSENFLILMLGGKDVMSMPGMDRKCQANMKAAPIKRVKSEMRKEQARELGINPREMTHEMSLTLVGTRFDESSARSKAMRLRGESATIPTLITKNGDTNWVLSPVADWSEEDVYTFIASVTNGNHGTYSDFRSLTEMYRDSMGECMALMGILGIKEPTTGCGARSGCFFCGAVEEDKSLNNMIKSRKEYRYMQPLADIRNYMVAQAFDPTKRCWTARSVNQRGCINISPNTYCSDYTLELLRIFLTADVEEFERTNGRPKFQNISFEELIYLDCLWSRYGYHNGHKALRVWNEIWEQGERYYVPQNYIKHERVTFPVINDVPFADMAYDDLYNGFQDGMAALADPDLFLARKESKDENGEIVNDYYFHANTQPSFTIDQEGLMLFLDYEYDDLIQNLDRKGEKSLFTYMRYGFVQINAGGHSEWDRMVRVGTQISRHNIDPSELNDPVVIIQRICKSLAITETHLAKIDKQLSDRKFAKFYQEHYHKPVVLTDGSEFTVQSVRKKEQQLEFAV